MVNNKFTARPNILDNNSKLAENFINKANALPENKVTPLIDTVLVLPWDEPFVRADVKKPINLVLSEPDFLKMKYVAKKQHKSQQEFMREAVQASINNYLKDMSITNE